MSQAAKWYLGARWGKGEDKTRADILKTDLHWGDGIASDQLRKSLYRYMSEQLGLAA